MKKYFGPYYGFVISAALVIVILMMSRLGLIGAYWQRVATIDNAATILLQGIRVDLASLSRLYIFPLILFVVAGYLPKAVRECITCICITYLSCIFVGFIFFEAITPTYIAEYGTRPERKFFEYLDSPFETFEMLWLSFRGPVILANAAVVFAALFSWKMHRQVFSNTKYRNPRWVAVSLPIVLFGLFVAGRATFDGKPLHPGQVAFTNDILLNNLPLNSLFSVSYAAYRIREEKDAGSLYGSLDEELIRATVQGPKPISKKANELSAGGRKLKNLVVILEESLGARYIEALGGEPIAPYVSSLANDGWWFDRMYATGTRTVRGIEAVVSGFLPTPGRSVVRLVDSQTRFFTIASLLSSAGYYSGFYYGGRSDFDNMRGFTLSNGFDFVFDEKSVEHGTFRSTYGYCDRDIFDAIHAALSANGGAPKFILNLTTSNHQPFEVPSDSGLEAAPKQLTRENAVRYADRALQGFIERAKASSYWDNTIFLVIADHDAKVAEFWRANDLDNPTQSTNIFPVEGFHIPAVILGGGVPVKRSAFITSQIDVPPTLLALLGVSAPHPMIGTDLTKVENDYDGRAIMQFADYHAHLSGEDLVVLRPSRRPVHAQYSNQSLSLKKDVRNANALEETALAYALWPNMVYKRGEYYMDYENLKL